jgi:hypothetical protein
VTAIRYKPPPNLFMRVVSRTVWCLDLWYLGQSETRFHWRLLCTLAFNSFLLCIRLPPLHTFITQMSSILISRAIPRQTVAATLVAGSSAYIAQNTYRQYATAKKAPNSLPGAMTFTDALNVLKVKNQRQSEI